MVLVVPEMNAQRAQSGPDEEAEIALVGGLVAEVEGPQVREEAGVGGV